MSAWAAVLAVGLVSYGFRVLPVAFAGRWAPSAATEQRLRLGSLSAITALAVGGLRSPELIGSAAGAVATVGAVVVAVAVARSGRPMLAVMAAGLAVHTVVLAAT